MPANESRGATSPNRTITAVRGIAVGHAAADDAPTGCTVVLGPFRAAVDIRGLATGTREIATLDPTHLVPLIDAIVLTGGSAPGLAAADGATEWLRERGRGFDTGGARIPIVPAAVIYDLRDGAAPPSYARLGRRACEAATTAPVAEGRVGAGAGATVGKILGPARAMRAGIGTSAVRQDSHTVGALVVLNAFGDVLDADGRIVAGARSEDGSFADSMRTALNVAATVPSPAANTTLCVIATDAPLSRTALQVIARSGSAAIARRTAPASTVFDGDVSFAVSTAGSAQDTSPAGLLALSVAAQLAVEEAILRAVAHAPG